MIVDIFILPMLVNFSQNTYKFIDNYIKKLDPVFKKIKFFENNGNISKYLKGPK